MQGVNALNGLMSFLLDNRSTFSFRIDAVSTPLTGLCHFYMSKLYIDSYLTGLVSTPLTGLCHFYKELLYTLQNIARMCQRP